MPDTQPSQNFLDANGVRLHYADWRAPNPDAPTVVLLHGLQDCAEAGTSSPPRLAQTTASSPSTAADTATARTPSPDAYTFRDYIADLEALVSHLGLSDFILAGHSAGARYAFVFAAEHPELIRALVVVDIDPDAVNPDSQGMFVRYNAESDEWDSLDTVVERLRDRQPQSTDDMLRHQLRL